MGTSTTDKTVLDANDVVIVKGASVCHKMINTSKVGEVTGFMNNTPVVQFGTTEGVWDPSQLVVQDV